MFNNILVPTDLNSKAYKASMYALSIAHRYDSKLFLLNVIKSILLWPNQEPHMGQVQILILRSIRILSN